MHSSTSLILSDIHYSNVIEREMVNGGSNPDLMIKWTSDLCKARMLLKFYLAFFFFPIIRLSWGRMTRFTEVIGMNHLPSRY